MNPLHFDAWRVFRIISEFVEGFEKMTDLGPSVSIFGSARIGPEHPYYKIATDVAHKIAKNGFAIITGGGPGVMEAANKGAQEAKGRSCGVSVEVPTEEDINPYIDRKYRLECRYFFVRKVMFMRYAQAVVFLPGGYGTLDELFEAVTLIQTKKIRPLPLFLIGTSYWTGLIEWLKTQSMEKEKFLNDEELKLITITDDLDLVADTILQHAKESGMAPTYDLQSEQAKG